MSVRWYKLCRVQIHSSGHVRGLDGLRCGSLLVVSHLFSDVGDIGHGDAGDIGHGDAGDIEHGDVGDGELVDKMMVYLLVAFVISYYYHCMSFICCTFPPSG